MPNRFIRTVFFLVLMHVVVGGITLAQTPAQQTPDSTPCGGMEKKYIEPYQGGSEGPIAVSVCDGHVYVGIISKTSPETFTLKTNSNQFIEINYQSVFSIGLDEYEHGQSKSEKIIRHVGHFLFLPFAIAKCIAFGCGS
jgi:hypothetical protein